jgi:hypothetical protein
MFVLMFDPKAPKNLIDLQIWFTKAVLNLCFEQGEETAFYLTQHSIKNLSLYSKQYFKKHIRSLVRENQDIYKEKGHQAFTQLAIYYLNEFPPQDYKLRFHREHFLGWLQLNQD